MSKLKKLTSMRLFLPIFCMLLVLAINVVYDIIQGLSLIHISEPTRPY